MVIPLAAADPFTRSYQVTVTQRADSETRVPVEIAPFSFGLSVSFDSAISNRFLIDFDDPDEPGTGEQRSIFGDPTFSACQRT